MVVFDSPITTARSIAGSAQKDSPGPAESVVVNEDVGDGSPARSREVEVVAVSVGVADLHISHMPVRD